MPVSCQVPTNIQEKKTDIIHARSQYIYSKVNKSFVIVPIVKIDIRSSKIHVAYLCTPHVHIADFQLYDKLSVWYTYETYILLYYIFHFAFARCFFLLITSKRISFLPFDISWQWRYFSFESLAIMGLSPYREIISFSLYGWLYSIHSSLVELHLKVK